MLKPRRKSIPMFKDRTLPSLTQSELADLLTIAAYGSKEDAQAAKSDIMLKSVRLACAIGSRFAAKWPAKSEDIMATAISAMVDHVDKDAAAGFTPEHFLRKMHVCITGAVKDFIAADNIMVIPNRSTWFQELYKKQGSAAYFPITGSLSYDAIVAAADAKATMGSHDKSIYMKAQSRLGSDRQYQAIIAADLLEHKALMPIERTTLVYTLEGYTDLEIAGMLGKSRQRAQQIKAEAIKKMRAIVTGDWSYASR